MGRHVSFDLRSGRKLDCPARHGMLYDASGTYWPSNSLLVAKFAQGHREDDAGVGRDYFGRDAVVYRGNLETPPKDMSGWKRIGDIETIFYDRAGTRYPGPFRHVFNKPRGLYKLVFWLKGKAGKEPAVLFKGYGCYRVELPAGCIIDERGIVLP